MKFTGTDTRRLAQIIEATKDSATTEEAAKAFLDIATPEFIGWILECWSEEVKQHASTKKERDKYGEYALENARDRDNVAQQVAVLRTELGYARKTIREFQEASMLGDHNDLPDSVTPDHVRQQMQDLGDHIDFLHNRLKELECQKS